MFGLSKKLARISKFEIHRTENFALEVLRAIIEYRLGKRIYFTMTNVEQYKHGQSNGAELRRLLIWTLFTDIDAPMRYGREGVPPKFPEALAEIIISADVGQVMIWRIHSVELQMLHLDDERAEYHELTEVTVPAQIHIFADALMDRGPRILSLP